MTGRGAWSVNGHGGTKRYKAEDRPGPYYYLGTGSKPRGRERTADEYAVWRAVVAYQAALNRALGVSLTLDGDFGLITSGIVLRFQKLNERMTGTPWGGIGPDTSEALLQPLLRSRVGNAQDSRITAKLISGTVRHESLWDAGAVGFLDETDVGLAQINGPAHPKLSLNARLDPQVAFDFVIDYYKSSLTAFNGNLRDAVASYNLGQGGTRSWIKAGRPDTWTPAGSDRARDVKGYIDSILKG